MHYDEAVFIQRAKREEPVSPHRLAEIYCEVVWYGKEVFDLPDDTWYLEYMKSTGLPIITAFAKVHGVQIAY